MFVWDFPKVHLYRGGGFSVLKKTKKAELRSLIDSVPLDEAFDQSQLARLNALTGWGALAAVHARNPTHPRDPRHVRIRTVEGGPLVARSWIKAVSPVDDYGRLLAACRFAVSDQMHEWLRQQKCNCAYCDSDRDPTADHVGAPFIVLVSDWSAGRDPAQLMRDRSTAEANSGDGALLHPAHWKDWRRYHAERARYQVLCRSCNARKGADNG